MQTLLNLIFFLALGQTTTFQPSVIIPHINEVRDIDGDGIDEKIITEYECFGTEENPLACKYYLTVYSGDEVAFPRTWITNDHTPEERKYYSEYHSDLTIPMQFWNSLKTVKINQDNSPDLLIMFQFGLEDVQTIAIDIKNKENIGCRHLYNYGWVSELVPRDDGRMDLRTKYDDEDNVKILDQIDFADCKDYWR